jgi:hypothetical protein
MFSDLDNMLRDAERWGGSAGCSRSGKDFLPLNRVFCFRETENPIRIYRQVICGIIICCVAYFGDISVLSIYRVTIGQHEKNFRSSLPTLGSFD